MLKRMQLIISVIKVELHNTKSNVKTGLKTFTYMYFYEYIYIALKNSIIYAQMRERCSNSP